MGWRDISGCFLLWLTFYFSYCRLFTILFHFGRRKRGVSGVGLDVLLLPTTTCLRVCRNRNQLWQEFVANYLSLLGRLSVVFLAWRSIVFVRSMGPNAMWSVLSTSFASLRPATKGIWEFRLLDHWPNAQQQHFCLPLWLPGVFHSFYTSAISRWGVLCDH